MLSRDHSLPGLLFFYFRLICRGPSLGVLVVPSPQMRNITRYFVVQQITIFTDHRLAVCELSFRPRIEKRTVKQPTLIDKSALRDENIQVAFQAEITQLLGQSDPDTLSTETLSSKVRSAPVTAAETVLPPKVNKKQIHAFLY